MKYSKEEDEEIYNDDELDFGYESEAMIIEPEEYIRFPLPKGKDKKKLKKMIWHLEDGFSRKIFHIHTSWNDIEQRYSFLKKALCSSV